ncbi:MAG: alanine--tRNA ligase, partial [Candidatus Levybacteria bacterium]|nr:alanine--tRNA ligase [Candidatus Levybacteria bacterium]
FAGGLADHSEQTIRGHTATHLLHQAIRDMLGADVYQKGSNITAQRVRFDFNYDRNLTEDEIAKLEQIVNEKIEANLPVFFEFMPLQRAKEIGAIGIFDEKYSSKVKIYFIGEGKPYSVEFCGGPHVNFTSGVKSFKIIKQENIGHGLRRLYALVG